MTWLLVTSGRGPGECEIAVAMATREIASDAAAVGVECEVLEAAEGRNGWVSALVALRGDGADSLAQTWEGTIQWTCPSLIRPGWGRKNWFVGVVRLVGRSRSAIGISERDLRWETMRASGPGGQHVNKTESAVRLKHLPTDIVVTAREERSQHRNKALALARLAAALDEQRQSEENALVQERWRKHDAVERGNPVRTYIGPEFKRLR